MDLNSLVFLLLGSTFGLTLRMYFTYNFKIKTGFYINNITLVNLFASLFLGIFVALNPVNKNLILLFYVGFLGCFSTFSSFIYRLFILFQRRQFKALFLHYIEVLILSLALFYLGYFCVQTFY